MKPVFQNILDEADYWQAWYNKLELKVNLQYLIDLENSNSFHLNEILSVHPKGNEIFNDAKSKSK